MNKILCISMLIGSLSPHTFGVMAPEEIAAGLKSHDRALHIKDGWIRDPYIVLAPDGTYYLTGTTPLPDEEREGTDKHNTGLGPQSIVGYKMQVWTSRDLIHWDYLGAPYCLEDGIWATARPQRFKQVERSNWRLWAPELHLIDGRWVIIHTSPSPVRGANLSVTQSDVLTGPFTNPMGTTIARRHDPSLFIDDDKSIWMIWGATQIAPLKPDLTGLAGEATSIGPANRKMGHEGCLMRKIGGKYVLFGTGWSTDQMRKGTYNLYYCTAQSPTGPYGPRQFAGRFLGHGTPFQDKTGRWWCTAFFNANVPPLSRDAIGTKDFSDNAYTINKQGVTLVPLEVKVLTDGAIYIRAKDPAYAAPGNEEVQDFGLSASGNTSKALTEAVQWLQQESHRIIRASRREMADGTAAFPPQVGIGYEAFWLRDFAYTLEGSVDSYSDKELLDASRLFISKLDANGAGLDCVKFDGTPIYRPGYGSMGDNPVTDGSQFTVAVLWHTYQKTKDVTLLKENIDALVKTMQAVPRNPATGLVHIKPEGYDRCPFGFTDTVRMAGDVLFSSLLFVEASRRLADLLVVADRHDQAKQWASEADTVAESIRKTFWNKQLGLFRAATIRCREPHIWGSAFAVYLSVADKTQSLAIANYFKDHYNQIVQAGQIRHLPDGMVWEQCAAARDTYQNGAYWATPTGWFVYTLDLIDPTLAEKTVIDLVADFQKGGACEWIQGDKRVLPNYLASPSLPLAGIQAMIQRRKN